MTSRALANFLLLVVSTALLCSGALRAEVQPLDQIVAIVDEDVVVRSELEQETTRILSTLRQRNAQIPPRNVLERQVLERLVLKKLQMARAQALGITIGEDVLAQTIGNIARENNLTLSEFRSVLESEGMSFDSYRQSVREQLTQRQLLDREVMRKIRVSDQELATFNSRQKNLSGRTDYHLLHILVAIDEGSSAEQLEQAREKAARLAERVQQGEEFSSLALTESDGRQALEGGDLGWRKSDQLPSLFVDIVDKMARGEVSAPIQSPSGYHIIKLVDYKGGERHIIDQTRVRHILINTNEITSNKDAQTRLQQLRQRILGGDDFAPLARSHSDDKTTAIKGGELGWVTAGDLVPRFEEQMNKLQPGELSQPFQTDFGWHIVQVLERRKHDSTEEVVKAGARAAIRQRKFNEESELYLRRLKDEAFILTMLDDA
ncbi:MAG: peptidylprolyl isomerase [Gammaproteobacteria bacterium]|nr:peptidylprolyl isomerase [Gammaproteobacteria bacterium]